MVRRRACQVGMGLVASVVSVGGWAAASAGPRVTIVDGSATVLDGHRLLKAAAGALVPAQAIVETGPDARLMRIEWPDGRALNLGPDTRLMLEPSGFTRRGRPVPALYLLQGWAKVTAPDGAKDGLPTLIAPQAQVDGASGVVVLRVDEGGTQAFVQAGSATVTERQVKSPESWTMRSGALLERPAKGPAILHDRASSAQLKDVPRAFRDTLPSRFAAAAALKPEPIDAGAPTYERLKPWLTAERSARAGFVPRFVRLLRDRDFRRGVDANLKAHPEWRPILYPPPPPPPPSAPVPRPAGR